jgi:hypothetical protein
LYASRTRNSSSEVTATASIQTAKCGPASTVPSGITVALRPCASNDLFVVPEPTSRWSGLAVTGAAEAGGVAGAWAAGRP